MKIASRQGWVHNGVRSLCGRTFLHFKEKKMKRFVKILIIIDDTIIAIIENIREVCEKIYISQMQCSIIILSYAGFSSSYPS